jgi:hypothetical protein
MITEEQMEKALDWIRENATRTAVTRAQKESMEDYTSILEATLMNAQEGPEHVKKASARSDPQYLTHWEAVKIAREEAYKYQYLMKAAEIRIQAYQTQSANNRRT